MEELIQEIENKLNTKIASYSFLGKGQCNDVYKLETKDKSFCLKIKKVIDTTCELNVISIEAEILHFMNEVEVPFIPKLILRSDNYYLYEYIEGMSMKHMFSSLSKRKKISIFESIGKFHYELSQLYKNKVLSLGITEYQPEKNKLNPLEHNLDRLNEEQKSFVHKAYEKYVNSINSSKPQLLHNDAHDENIFVSSDKPIFIDFGDMIWRDIHYDFYRYVHDYPRYWNIIILEFEKLSMTKLDRERIIAISLLRHLKGFILDIESKDDFNKELEYYSELLK
ncbi:MAG: Ser/Thr protein kinase RdoA (MazF antagonist) [Flavobacteriaceae bacterium]|jgi:Ser/Thr protein kinase RdoA (MazF antagonist)